MSSPPPKTHRATSSCCQKSASGDFFESSEKSHQENPLKPLKLRQKIEHTPTKIASDVLFEHYRYTAFGEVEVYSPTGQKLEKSAIGNNKTWNNRTTDWDTGLLYYKGRHYNPRLGRWLGRDPIEEWGGLNLYAFVGNDPFNRWDVYGYVPFWIKPLGVGIGAAGAAIIATAGPELIDVKVGKCEAKLIITHGDDEDLMNWSFEGGWDSSIGGTVCCYPKQNNPVADRRRWPNLPGHTQPISIGDWSDKAALDMQTQKGGGVNGKNNTKEVYVGEHAVRNALDGAAMALIKKQLCKCCEKYSIKIEIGKRLGNAPKGWKNTPLDKIEQARSGKSMKSGETYTFDMECE